MTKTQSDGLNTYGAASHRGGERAAVVGFARRINGVKNIENALRVEMERPGVGNRGRGPSSKAGVDR